MKQAGRKIELNGGELKLVVTKAGDVAVVENFTSMHGEVELNAGDLDAVAAVSMARRNLPDETHGGHDIEVCHDGDVVVGCQTITAADVAQVHAVSLAMRGL